MAVRERIRPEGLRGADGGAFNADDVPITDTGAYYTSGNVEGALAEVGADIASLEAAIIPPVIPGSIGVCFDGMGQELVAGKVQDVVAPADGTITSWELLADQSGSCSISILKDTYANYPPGPSDSITGGTDPALSSQAKNADATLSGWITTVTAGDIVRFTLDSVSICTRLVLVLIYERTG